MKKILPLPLLVLAASLSSACGGDEGSEALVNPFETGDAAAIAAGMSLFTDESCNTCHGDDGAGTSIGADLTQITDATSDESMYNVITKGRGSMPAYDELTENETWQLVTYVRSL